MEFWWLNKLTTRYNRAGARESINIEDVEVGDSVISLNMETLEYEKSQVLEIIRGIEKQKFTIKFDNGVNLSTSNHHPIYVKGKGWSVINKEVANDILNLPVENLEIGDTIIFYNDGGIQNEVTISLIKEDKENVKMYNLIRVKGMNTFFANGVLVHNKFIDVK